MVQHGRPCSRRDEAHAHALPRRKQGAIESGSAGLIPGRAPIRNVILSQVTEDKQLGLAHARGEMTTFRASPSPMLAVSTSGLSCNAICTMRRS